MRVDRIGQFSPTILLGSFWRENMNLVKFCFVAGGIFFGFSGGAFAQDDYPKIGLNSGIVAHEIYKSRSSPDGSRYGLGPTSGRNKKPPRPVESFLRNGYGGTFTVTPNNYGGGVLRGGGGGHVFLRGRLNQ